MEFEFKEKFNVINQFKNKKFDVVIIALKHFKFIKMKKQIKILLNKNGFIYDLKYLFSENQKSTDYDNI